MCILCKEVTGKEEKDGSKERRGNHRSPGRGPRLRLPGRRRPELQGIRGQNSFGAAGQLAGRKRRARRTAMPCRGQLLPASGGKTATVDAEPLTGQGHLGGLSVTPQTDELVWLSLHKHFRGTRLLLNKMSNFLSLLQLFLSPKKVSNLKNVQVWHRLPIAC